MIIQNLAKSIIKRELRLGGIDRIVSIANRPSVYSGTIDVDISYTELWAALQEEAKSVLSKIQS